MEGNFTALKEDFYRYVKFLFGGSLSLILNLIFTYFLTEFLHFWHMLSFAFALGMEIIFLFIYHSVVTFRRRGRFLIFVIVILIISLLNWLAVFFLSITLKIQYLLAIIISAGIISIINYFINKTWVFAPKRLN